MADRITKQTQAWFIRLVDALIKNKETLDNDRLYRSRILSGIILLNISITLVISLVVVFYVPFPPQQTLLAGIILVALLAVYLTAVFVYRFFGNFVAVGNVVIGAGYFATMTGAIFNNGLATSELASLLVIPGLMAFSIMGRRAGMIWAAICGTTLLGLVLLQYNNLSFYPYGDGFGSAYIFMLLINFILVTALFYLYEVLTRRLKKERDLEHARYEFLASHDDLTQLPNRTRFLQVLMAAMSQGAERKGMPQQRSPGEQVALAIIDLDGFKLINDTYGHQAGDFILKHVSLQLRSAIRSNDMVARFGGDEFCVLYQSVNAVSDLSELCYKLVEAVRKPINYQGRTLKVSASIGIALYPGHSKDPDELWRFADEAMYLNKKSKNSWTVYSSDISRSAQASRVESVSL